MRLLPPPTQRDDVASASIVACVSCENICGTVYKLSPSAGTWKETILHAFVSATDGSEPNAGVILDSSGNIYGTTYYGGSRYGYGTIYEITP